MIKFQPAQNHKNRNMHFRVPAEYQTPASEQSTLRLLALTMLNICTEEQFDEIVRRTDNSMDWVCSKVPPARFILFSSIGFAIVEIGKIALAANGQ